MLHFNFYRDWCSFHAVKYCSVAPKLVGICYHGNEAELFPSLLSMRQKLANFILQNKPLQNSFHENILL